MERVLSAPEEVRILCAVTFFETVQQVEEKFGRISNLSNDRKQDLAAHLSTIGLKKFQTNFRVSLWLFPCFSARRSVCSAGRERCFRLFKDDGVSEQTRGACGRG